MTSGNTLACSLLTPVLCGTLLCGRVAGVVLYDSGNPTVNTAAPTGALAFAGWQHQGYFGGFLGTVIGQNEFITARHIGVQGSTFSRDALFTGTATQQHLIDATANGGLGYFDIAGTDLRVYRVVEPFSSWAPLHTAGSEVGAEMFVTGRGGARGAAISGGWLLSPADGVARWGENDVEGIVSFSGLGQMLTVDFDALSGENEAFLSVGDSGGATFIKHGGEWQLAGIHYAIDGPYSASASGTAPFSAALTDATGYYAQSALGVWLPITGNSQFYDSRISSNALAIQSLITIPESSSALYAATAAATLLRRSRKNGARTSVRPHKPNKRSIATCGLKSALQRKICRHLALLSARGVPVRQYHQGEGTSRAAGHQTHAVSCKGRGGGAYPPSPQPAEASAKAGAHFPPITNNQ